VAPSLNETLTSAQRAAVEVSDRERDREAWNLPRAAADTGATSAHTDRGTARGTVRLLHGRFEARFDDASGARAAARDAGAVGFMVEVRDDGAGWIAVGRRRLPFPGDERDRYASRLRAIATKHGGVFAQFVEEPDESPAHAAGPSPAEER